MRFEHGLPVGIAQPIPATGEARLDVGTICDGWTLLDRIVRHEGHDRVPTTYRLVSYSPKGRRRRVSVRISERDARDVIDRLHLAEVHDPLFVRCTTYLSV